MQILSLMFGFTVFILYSISSNFSVNIERMSAYSIMALKIMKMQVMMNPSIAFSFVDPDDGAFERTLLKTLMITRKRITRRDILPGMT